MTQKKHVVESMKAAAAILGLQKYEIQQAKWDGCKAFRPGNRIDVDELRSWFNRTHKGTIRANDGVILKELSECVDELDEMVAPGRIPRNFFTHWAFLQAWAVKGLIANKIPKARAVEAVEKMSSEIALGKGDELWDKDFWKRS